jgi:hypothetical protein
MPIFSAAIDSLIKDVKDARLRKSWTFGGYLRNFITGKAWLFVHPYRVTMN